MGLPGHAKLRIKTVCENSVFSRKIELLGWNGLCGMAVAGYFLDAEEQKKSTRSYDLLKNLINDTMLLEDGVYKISKIDTGNGIYKYRSIEEVPKENRDLYE